MYKRVFYIFLLLTLLVACSNNDKIIKKAGKNLGYNALIPSYLPPELELEKVVLEEDLFIQTYTNDNDSVYIEIIQRQYARSLNIEELLGFTKMGTDPYEPTPNPSYVMIDNFVGEYKINSNLNSIDYQFIPIIPQTEVDWYPFYWANSVGIEEHEFHKVIKSLE